MFYWENNSENQENWIILLAGGDATRKVSVISTLQQISLSSAYNPVTDSIWGFFFC